MSLGVSNNKGEGEEMKSIVVSRMMAFLLVKYPYRQSKDAYIIANGHPTFCVQCQKEMPVEELIEHIHYHDKRKGKADIIAIKDGETFVIESFTTQKN